MPFLPSDEMQWRTVETAFSGGVDLRAPSRLVQPPQVVKAENVRFDTLRAGFRRRRGHRKQLVRTAARLDLDAAVGSYLYGVGVYGGEDATDMAGGGGFGGGGGGFGVVSGDIPTAPASESGAAGPDAGFLRGMAKRDNEVLAWDGWRMFSYPPGADYGAGWQMPARAIMPTVETTPVAKTALTQDVCDLAVADGVAVVAWVSGASVCISVYDPETWTPYLLNEFLDNSAHTTVVRTVPCGEWVHIFACRDTAAGTLHHWAIHRSRPVEVNDLGSEGGCNIHFDVKKLSETRFLVCARDTDESVWAAVYSDIGSPVTAHMTLLDGVTDEALRVAIAQHPNTQEFGLLWQDSNSPDDTYFSVFTSGGGLISTTVFTSENDTTQLAIEAQYRTNADDGKFQVYVQHTDGGATCSVNTAAMWNGGASATVERFWTKLASHPWRVGNEVFCNLVSYYTGTAELQTSVFICDTQLRPVGRMERGTAKVPLYLSGVYFDKDQGTRNRTRFHGALGYRVRVDSPNNDQFDEASIKLANYNFMPKLRSAQLGRCVYFPGAQLHMYDGRTVTEAGVHIFPEHVSVNAGVGTGLTGTYDWIVKWARKTAQGEEIVSAGLVTSEVALANKDGQIIVPTLGMTRSDDAYLLVYRREATGTLYYLVTSRDPADAGATPDASAGAYYANDPTVPTITVIDKMSDANLVSKEYDTIGNTGELQPFSPPASTILASGRDRLWLAGGELPPGDILPSKTYKDGFGPQFNQFLQTTIDRNYAPVTSIAFMGNSSLVFKASAVYAFEADGPNNLGQGGFDQPRVIVTDTGAVSPDATFLSTDGVWYQSSVGLTLLGTNYYVTDVGEPVHPEAVGADFVSVCMTEQDQELRFYRSDGMALVFNTVNKQWTTWTGLECVGAVQQANGLAVLGRADGTLLVEEEGLWRDGNAGYTGLVRTAVLHAGILQGFQRIRRMSLLGDFRGDHTLSCRVYYNDHEFAEDSFSWAPLDDLNDDTFGAGDYGDGVWGDTTATAAGATYTAVRDRLYQVNRRLARQKCARIQFEFDDGGCNSEGPAFTALALELGQRGGLSRLPTRSI